MNYTISSLGPDDNQSLLDLARLSHTGSDLFYVDRAPDFFALASEWGSPHYYGLMRHGQLIGCLGATRQKRFLAGREEDVIYLHDLRVHPAFSSTRAYHRLVTVVMDRLREQTNWVFATVLDSNVHRSVLTRGKPFFPSAIPIGSTIHCGVPLFWLQPGDWKSVRPISPDAAWEAYAAWASQLDFAPADQTLFRNSSGSFLGFFREGSLTAVCKIIDQSGSRRLVSAKSTPFTFRLLNPLCRLRGTPSLPNQGEVFRHGYLAYYASVDSSDVRRHFLAYLSRLKRKEYTYIFFGLSANEADSYKSPINIRLSSTTFAYGKIPPDLHLIYHELTMI